LIRVLSDKNLLVLYKDTTFRRRLHSAESADSGYEYMLFGINTLKKSFSEVYSNMLKPSQANKFQKGIFFLISKVFFLRYSLSFNFRIVWENKKEIFNSKRILCTSDSITLPLTFFVKCFPRKSRKITCITVGMVDRLSHLKMKKKKRVCSLLNNIDHIICFSLQEKELLELFFIETVGSSFQGKIEFMRFGVDLDFFPFVETHDKDRIYDICSIGSDSKRDFNAVYELAKECRSLDICVVIGSNHKEFIDRFSLLPNVLLRVDVHISEIREILNVSKVSWLPVYENSYTGAFTVMLQSMAAGTPVVVPQVSANRGGYFLQHKKNVFLTLDNKFLNSYDVINSALNNYSLRKEVSVNARRLVESYNNIDNVYKTIDSIVKS